MTSMISLPPVVTWRPILDQMVDSGDLAIMHPRALSLYVAIKRYADIQTGIAEIPNTKLMNKCGISKPTLYLARDSLRDLGYISYDDSKRPTTYVVYEKIRYFSPERALIASAKVQYIPTINQTVLEKLRKEPLTQELARVGGMRIDACKVEIQVLASIQSGSGLAISVHVETSDSL